MRAVVKRNNNNLKEFSTFSLEMREKTNDAKFTPYISKCRTRTTNIQICVSFHYSENANILLSLERRQRGYIEMWVKCVLYVYLFRDILLYVQPLDHTNQKFIFVSKFI